MLLIGSYNMGYNQLKMDINNNYIMSMDCYLQDLPGVMKLLNNYIIESRKNRNVRNTSGK